MRARLLEDPVVLAAAVLTPSLVFPLRVEQPGPIVYARKRRMDVLASIEIFPGRNLSIFGLGDVQDRMDPGTWMSTGKLR